MEPKRDREGSGEVSPDLLLEKARELLGVTYLFPYQRLVVANTIDAHAASEDNAPEAAELSRQVVVLPTGSGKTLCFLLPAVLLPGVTVVVYPLLSLMADQQRRASDAGITASILRGGMSRGDRRVLFDALRSGDCRMLITNPEMLALRETQEELSALVVSHLVIDEAHCVSEWGLSFRPSYLALCEAMTAIAPTVTTAFTATASDTVLHSVVTALFGDAPTRLVRADPDRPNISYAVVPVHSKVVALESLLSGPRPVATPAIVFCRSRIRTESYARKLADHLPFTSVAGYHAGLPPDERSRIERWFFEADDAVLVATCAYGMGVDKKNVRSVIHVDLPPSIEAFLQESGRAGRDRGPALSVVLCAPRDVVHATGERQQLVLGYLTAQGCRRDYLMRVMGAESESCFGCDSCSPDSLPTAIEISRARDRSSCLRVEQLVARYPRLFRGSQLITMLPGTKSQNEELLDSLVATRRIATIRRGPWKGRLTIARSHEPVKGSRKHLV